MFQLSITDHCSGLIFMKLWLPVCVFHFFSDYWEWVWGLSGWEFSSEKGLILICLKENVFKKKSRNKFNKTRRADMTKRTK